jgi:hypothetical protein
MERRTNTTGQTDTTDIIMLEIDKHLDKLLLPPFVDLLLPPLPSSSSSRMRNLDGWMTGRMTN